VTIEFSGIKVRKVVLISNVSLDPIFSFKVIKFG